MHLASGHGKELVRYSRLSRGLRTDARVEEATWV
jgi:hypothetical protein